jgi:hypothetical protein
LCNIRVGSGRIKVGCDNAQVGCGYIKQQRLAVVGFRVVTVLKSAVVGLRLVVTMLRLSVAGLRLYKYK